MVATTIAERERDAGLCKEYDDKAAHDPTYENVEKAEHIAGWFEKKHHCEWRDYVKKEAGWTR